MIVAFDWQQGLLGTHHQGTILNHLGHLIRICRYQKCDLMALASNQVDCTTRNTTGLRESQRGTGFPSDVYIIAVDHRLGEEGLILSQYQQHCRWRESVTISFKAQP